MKLIVSSAVLQKQLAALSSVVPSNPIVPILDNFLFDLNQNELTVSASDLNVSMTTRVSVESTDTGRVAVPSKILLDTLKSLPEQPITFAVDPDTHAVEITSYSGRYKLPGESAEDFPRIPSAEKSEASLVIPSEVLGKALHHTLFAVSTDELRPAMTGVYFDLSPEEAVLVATDGHRLVRYTRKDVQSSQAIGVIVPRKALATLEKALPNDVDVHAEFDTSNAFFSFGQYHLVARLVDETFPDYRNAIPVENPNKLEIERGDFYNAIKRAMIYANKATHQIRLKVSETQMQIFAEDQDYANEANERLACEYNGEEMEIGFNARLLSDVLANIDCKEMTMEMSTPRKAGIVKPKEQPDYEDTLLLIMPVMLNNSY
ncbi:DNA polymerase III subunit beta [Eisenibacter elegans]|jgi:DNA polymerase-3 subunit beta|uniref:DNA polymerase III subunit beta n=1 Tax=Eisenibacter elegans TaxID=997 RepID=UPI0004294F0E|nr:DNA polymerase III subunit beta [Eisenibacter elegans]